MSFRIRVSKSELRRLQLERVSAWIQVLQHATLADNAAFVAWLKESPQNCRDILLMLTVERALNKVDVQRLNDTTALIAQVDSTVVALPPRQGRPPPLLLRTRTLRWAAAGIAALFVGGSAYYLEGHVGWTEYRTGASEQRAFVLTDGSIVHLNTHSRIAVRLTPKGREVRLMDGEALFRVQHDPATPFRVYTENAEIEDVGTEFDVNSRAEGTFVAVLEGRVNVASVKPVPATTNSLLNWMRPDYSGGRSKRADFQTLVASQEAQIGPSGFVLIHDVSNASHAAAWRNWRLVFRQESLERIVEQFNRFNSRKIRLDGPGVASRIYGGIFDAYDTDTLLQVLRKDLDLDVVIRSRGPAAPSP
jgi:transmembrane sensor